jgi:hypothetical protein
MSTGCALSAIFLALKLRTDVLQNINNGCADNFWSYGNPLRDHSSSYRLYPLAKEK